MPRKETPADRHFRRAELLARLAVFDGLIEETRGELETLERFMFERVEIGEHEFTV